MKKEVKQNTGPSDYQVLMNWMRDGNLKSPYPKQLENSRAIVPTYILSYFLPSPKYFIFINDVFNRYSIFQLNIRDVMMTFKTIIYYTGFSSFSKRKVQPKDNELVNILKLKYPYYKKEEILMVVKMIDESEDKDTIYEMFELSNKSKVKKLTKSKIKSREDKIKSIVNSKEVLEML